MLQARSSYTSELPAECPTQREPTTAGESRAGQSNPAIQVRVPILEVVFSHSCGAKGWRVLYIDPYLVGKLALPATSRCMGRHIVYTVLLVEIAGERSELLQRVSLYWKWI